MIHDTPKMTPELMAYLTPEDIEYAETLGDRAAQWMLDTALWNRGQKAAAQREAELKAARVEPVYDPDWVEAQQQHEDDLEDC